LNGVVLQQIQKHMVGSRNRDGVGVVKDQGPELAWVKVLRLVSESVSELWLN